MFDLRDDGELLQSVKEELRKPGVYVLYQNERPHYIGKTKRSLFQRVYEHANHTQDKLYNFWNFFSAFEVPENHLDEVEAVLIAAMPTANSANPKIPPIGLPRQVISVLARRREIDVAHPKLITK